MALNCSMLTPNNEPVPLPDEKIFRRLGSVSASLSPTDLGSSTTLRPASSVDAATDTSPNRKSSLFKTLSAVAKSADGPDDHKTLLGRATGTVYVTNQRLLFVASDAHLSLPLLSIPPLDPSAQLGQKTPLLTLSVPLSHSFDGRFIQPWLSPNYHLSTVVPVPGGNLDPILRQMATSVHQPLADALTLKLVFHQGTGFEFHEALEEAKRLMVISQGRAGAVVEELPMYTPPPDQSFLPTTSPPSNPAHLHSLPPVPSSSAELAATPAGMPHPDLLLAAGIAREQERQERDGVLIDPPPSSHLPPNDQPPTYHP